MAKPNLLNSIKLSRPGMSGFDMSHDVKLSGNMGWLIPVMCMECVPSDKMRASHEGLHRLAPMTAPMMHRCNVSFHDYFVPFRLLWPNFDKWITNQKNDLGLLPAFPTVNIGETGWEAEIGSLCDYLGIPPLIPDAEIETVNAMPFAAYQMIYNEYYRDQNQINEVPFELIDGDNTANDELAVLRKRAWEHDYFTSAAKEPQAGAAVDLPLGTVELNLSKFDPVSPPHFIEGVDGTTTDAGTYSRGTAIPRSIVSTGNDADTLAYDPQGTLEVGATTINDLRTAFRLQEWLEKSMRGGKRLFENILIFFGLRSPDQRMQRPEYIGGSVTPIQISEVLNTTGTAEAPQGDMAGHGVAVAQGRANMYSCQEWGYVITIMSVMPKTAYQQGIHRMFLNYKDPMQKYWPQFDHLGEQEIEQRELYAYKDTGSQVFGYTPRYAEFKFMNNRVAGEFRTTLDFWHMGRIFDDAPGLNQSFIEADPTHRVFAVTDPAEHKLWMHIYHKVHMIRPMSKFSTPTF